MELEVWSSRYGAEAGQGVRRGLCNQMSDESFRNPALNQAPSGGVIDSSATVPTWRSPSDSSKHHFFQKKIGAGICR